MSEARLTDEVLGRALSAMSEDVAFPRTPPIAPAVVTRLREEREANIRPPFPSLALWNRRRALVLVIVGIAAVLAVPLGVMAAVYLVEYGKGRLARAITFFVDVMTGIPSIVAGLRVALGVDLLANTGLPIAAIAGRCGFTTPHHFSRRVRQATGMPPGALRRARWLQDGAAADA